MTRFVLTLVLAASACHESTPALHAARAPSDAAATTPDGGDAGADSAVPDGGTEPVPDAGDAGDAGTVPVRPRVELGESCDDERVCVEALSCERGRCMEPWSGLGCEPAELNRPPCTGAFACEAGLVCHVDDTCIEPGKCDPYGETTLATLAELVEVRGVWLDAEYAYLLDWGTGDNFGNHLGDGAIARVPLLTGGIPEIVIAGIDRPFYMMVDAIRLFWNAGMGTQTLFSADKVDGGNVTEIARVANSAWTQSATHLYFATQDDDGTTELFRLQKGTTTVERLTDDEDWLPSLAVDSQSIFAYSDALYTVPLAGGERTLLPEGPTEQAYPGRLALGRDLLFFTEGETDLSNPLWSLTKAGTDLTILAGFGDESSGARDLVPYREHVYYTVSESYTESDVDTYRIERVPISPGGVEVLATPPRSRTVFAVSDHGLYFVQRRYPAPGRLVRHVISDYQPAPTPAQGESGGPCQPDLSCAAALQCIDTLCE